jgi:hypothetical protein
MLRPNIFLANASCYYSVLFYNLAICSSPILDHNSQLKLLSVSRNALRMWLHDKWQNVSFLDLHKITKRATPKEVANSKVALQLCNQMSRANEWLHLNWNQILTPRQIKFIENREKNYTAALTCLANKFHYMVKWMD